MTVTINTVLKQARQRLAGEAQPTLEAEILLAHALDTRRSFLYANPDLTLPDVRLNTFNRLLQSRLIGTPIAYLTGIREFWSLTLEVTPDTLIPRPETELLVTAALNVLPESSSSRVVDLGTGCGAVALAIASERPGLVIGAVDVSEAALTVARNNAARHHLHNVEFVHSNWFDSLVGKFDVVVSNPPYIAAGDQHLAAGDLRFEPGLALLAGPDGLDAIRQIIAGCASALHSNGYLLMEHGFEQAGAVRQLLENEGFTEIETLQDLESRDRVTIAQSGD